MRIKLIHKKLALLLLAFLMLSCQSMQSSFGEFKLNNYREAMLTTIGYKDNSLFYPNKFVSFATITTENPIQVHIKKDSIKLNKRQQLEFEYEEAQSDSLAKLKKPVTLISIFNKQDLIKQINAQVDLTARPDLEVVTDILVKDQSAFERLIKADVNFFQFNSRQNAYEFVYFKNGEKGIVIINPNLVIGYKSMFLCCKTTNGKLTVKNLSENKCPAESFKTLNDNSKTENYEKL